MMDNNFDDLDSQDEFKSKTQRKAEMTELQKMGEKLVSLTPGVLDKMALDPELLDAILLAKRISNTKEGWRRQLQFIGKLMRHRDVEPIQRELDKLESHHLQENKKFHQLEMWRDKLLLSGDPAVNQLLDEYPSLDRQKLRTLIRQASKQQKEHKPPKAAREIFQYLKENISDNHE